MIKSVLRAISSQGLAQQLCHQVTILPLPQEKSGSLFCYKTSITLGSFIIMTTLVILLLIKKNPNQQLPFTKRFTRCQETQEML